MLDSGMVELPPADELLEEGDVIDIDGMKLEVMHTPGHTRGSICIVNDSKFVFTGDTLFCGSIGRSDLPGGNEKVLMESLKRLKKINGSVVVYPGHGPASTISEELRSNPYLR